MPSPFQTDAFQPDAFQQAVPTTGDPYPPSLSGPTLIVAGVDRTAWARAGARAIDLSYTFGSRGVLRCETVDLSMDTSLAYRPAIDESISLDLGMGLVFSGTVVEAGERPLGLPDRFVVGEISAVDHSTILAIRIINDIWTEGVSYTLKQIITWIVTTYLAADGVTVDASQADGATFTEGMVFENVTAESALNYLSSVTGWPWRMDATKAIKMWAPGSVGAPFAITESTVGLSLTVRKARTKYANRIILTYGGAQDVTEVWTADGTMTTFPLKYPGIANADGMIVSQGYVIVDDHTGSPVKFDVGKHPSASTLFDWDEANNVLYAGLTLGAGVTVTFVHSVQFTLTEIVEDLTQIAARGRYEVRVDVPNTFDRAHVQRLGASLLRKYLAVAREVTVRFRSSGFMAYPGETISIAVPSRLLSGNWLITQVRVQDLSNTEFEYELTCLEGNEAQMTWVDYFKQVFGHDGTSGSSGTITGSTNYTPTGLHEGEVFANTGLNTVTTGFEVSLRDGTDSKGTGGGIHFNRADSDRNWQVFAETSERALHVGFYPDKVTGPAFRLKRTAFGEVVLMPTVMVGTGGQGLYLGDPEMKSGEVSSFDRTLAGVRTNILHALDGIYERFRTVRMGEWQTYVPTWTASGSNPAIVNGTLAGWYTLMGKTVHVEILLVPGTGTTFGAGTWLFSLPVPAHADYGGSGRYPKTLPATAVDNNTALFYACAGEFSTATTIFVNAFGSSVVNPTTPFTWALADRLMINGTYEMA